MAAYKTPLTISLWLSAVILAAALFAVSAEVRKESRVLRHLSAEIATERDRAEILYAEWHYLNNPERLSAAIRDIKPAPVPRALMVSDMTGLPLRHEGEAVFEAGSEDLRAQTASVPVRPVTKPSVRLSEVSPEISQQSERSAQLGELDREGFETLLAQWGGR